MRIKLTDLFLFLFSYYIHLQAITRIVDGCYGFALYQQQSVRRHKGGGFPLIYDPLVTLDFLRLWFSLRSKKVRTCPLFSTVPIDHRLTNLFRAYKKESRITIALDRILAHASLAIPACLFRVCEGRKLRRNMYTCMIYIHEWRSLIPQFQPSSLTMHCH